MGGGGGLSVKGNLALPCKINLVFFIQLYIIIKSDSY